MELAFRTGLSQRHLSFLETGRAQPSREAVLQICTALDVPLRERNTLLTHAGFASVYPESPVPAPGLAHARRALELLLKQQEPYPTLVLDPVVLAQRENEGRFGAKGRSSALRAGIFKASGSFVRFRFFLGDAHRASPVPSSFR